MSHIEKQEILEAEIQLGIEARQWGQKKKNRLEAGGRQSQNTWALLCPGHKISLDQPKHMAGLN